MGSLIKDCVPPHPTPFLLPLRLKQVMHMKPSALVYLRLGSLGTKFFPSNNIS